MESERTIVIASGEKTPSAMLNELAQKRGQSVIYSEVERTGPSHLPGFTFEVRIGDYLARGTQSGSKQEGKQSAAQAWMEKYARLTLVPLPADSPTASPVPVVTVGGTWSSGAASSAASAAVASASMPPLPPSSPAMPPLPPSSPAMPPPPPPPLPSSPVAIPSSWIQQKVPLIGCKTAVTLLNEWTQARRLPPPKYAESIQAGPGHVGPVFAFSVAVGAVKEMGGPMLSKQEAKQGAAYAYLEKHGGGIVRAYTPVAIAAAVLGRDPAQFAAVTAAATMPTTPQGAAKRPAETPAGWRASPAAPAASAVAAGAESGSGSSGTGSGGGDGRTRAGGSGMPGNPFQFTLLSSEALPAAVKPTPWQVRSPSPAAFRGSSGGGSGVGSGSPTPPLSPNALRMRIAGLGSTARHGWDGPPGGEMPSPRSGGERFEAAPAAAAAASAPSSGRSSPMSFGDGGGKYDRGGGGDGCGGGGGSSRGIGEGRDGGGGGTAGDAGGNGGVFVGDDGGNGGGGGGNGDTKGGDGSSSAFGFSESSRLPYGSSYVTVLGTVAAEFGLGNPEFMYTEVMGPYESPVGFVANLSPFGGLPAVGGEIATTKEIAREYAAKEWLRKRQHSQS